MVVKEGSAFCIMPTSPEARESLLREYVIQSWPFQKGQSEGSKLTSCFLSGLCQPAHPGQLCKLMIRNDESTSQICNLFPWTDQTDKGRKNQAEL